VIPVTGDSTGGCVGKVANALTVGVGLNRPFGSEGVLAESQPPSRTARGSAVAKNGLRKRMDRRELQRARPGAAIFLQGPLQFPVFLSLARSARMPARSGRSVALLR
jgi:hypothetical protein